MSIADLTIELAEGTEYGYKIPYELGPLDVLTVSPRHPALEISRVSIQLPDGDELVMDGVISHRNIPAGTILVLNQCPISHERTKTSVQAGISQFGNHLHIEEDTIIKINHAWIDKANSVLRTIAIDENNRMITVAMVACKDIQAGDQVTFCYAGTEVEVIDETSGIKDINGSEEAPENILGFSQLTPTQQELVINSGHAALHIVELYRT